MIKQKYSRLIISFEKQNKSLIFGNNTPANKLLIDAMNHLKKNWNKTNDEVLRMILDSHLQGENSLDVKREERVKYYEYLTETIRNILITQV